MAMGLMLEPPGGGEAGPAGSLKKKALWCAFQAVSIALRPRFGHSKSSKFSLIYQYPRGGRRPGRARRAELSRGRMKLAPSIVDPGAPQPSTLAENPAIATLAMREPSETDFGGLELIGKAPNPLKQLKSRSRVVPA